VGERINRLWHKSPAVSNDLKMIAMKGAEKAVVKEADPVDIARLAGMVIVVAYHDGTVSSLSSNLTKEGAIRALQYALFASGHTQIGKRSELD
jgi:hypothetical protein